MIVTLHMNGVSVDDFSSQNVLKDKFGRPCIIGFSTASLHECRQDFSKIEWDTPEPSCRMFDCKAIQIACSRIGVWAGCEFGTSWSISFHN